MSGIQQGLIGSYPKLWTPALITTALWLDAADAATITLNVSNVSQWDDKSGNARNATQATGSRQPTYASSKVSFDGTELMELPGSFVSLNAVSSFVVGRYAASVGAVNYLVFMNGAGSDTRFYNSSVPTDFSTFGWSVEVALGPTVAANTNTNLFGLTHGSNTATAYLNAASIGTATRTKTASLSAVFLGGISSTVPRLNGEIQEVIVLGSVPSNDDRQKLEGYLAWKWGLTANLPALHPYKTTPPTA